MKKATCKDLRGPCDFEVVGDTAEEMGDAGKKHVMEMVAAGDEDHKVAMDSMMNLNPMSDRNGIKVQLILIRYKTLNFSSILR
jgi:hypothetical protein